MKFSKSKIFASLISIILISLMAIFFNMGSRRQAAGFPSLHNASSSNINQLAQNIGGDLRSAERSSCQTQSKIYSNFMYISYEVRYKVEGEEKEVVVMIGADPSRSVEEGLLQVYVPSTNQFGNSLDFFQYDLGEIIELTPIDILIPLDLTDQLADNLANDSINEINDFMNSMNDFANDIGQVSGTFTDLWNTLFSGGNGGTSALVHDALCDAAGSTAAGTATTVVNGVGVAAEGIHVVSSAIGNKEDQFSNGTGEPYDHDNHVPDHLQTPSTRLVAAWNKKRREKKKKDGKKNGMIIILEFPFGAPYHQNTSISPNVVQDFHNFANTYGCQVNVNQPLFQNHILGHLIL